MPTTICVNCAHFERCAFLISTLRGDEKECDFSPSRFQPANRWGRATNKAIAVGRAAAEGRPVGQLGGHFAAKGAFPVAENAKDYETVREILVYAAVTGGLSRAHEKKALKALERIRQNRDWEVARARNNEREACAKVCELESQAWQSDARDASAESYEAHAAELCAEAIRARSHAKESS